MKKSREIKELLILLRDKIILSLENMNRTSIADGLCFEVSCLRFQHILNDKEAKTLRAYIYANKPYNAKYDGYGWRPTLWKCRLKWLNGQINSLN